MFGKQVDKSNEFPRRLSGHAVMRLLVMCPKQQQEENIRRSSSTILEKLQSELNIKQTKNFF